MLEGRGAGRGPTASAVVADLDRHGARPRMPPVVRARPRRRCADAPSVPMERHVGAYYLRLMVLDRPGVIADVTAALRDERRLARSHAAARPRAGRAVPVVLTTHETQRGRDAARRWSAIAALDAVLEAPALIRIEPALRTL